VCGNDAGSQRQQPEGKFSHESRSYFDGVTAVARLFPNTYFHARSTFDDPCRISIGVAKIILAGR
jgi:hypothetical protein